MSTPKLISLTLRSGMSSSSLWFIPRKQLVGSGDILWQIAARMRPRIVLWLVDSWHNALWLALSWHEVSRVCMTWQWMDFKSSVWGLTATQCILIVQRADNNDKRPVTGPSEGECGQCSQSSERRSFTRHKCCCLLSLNNLLSSLCLLDACQEWAASSSETGGMYKYFMLLRPGASHNF